MIDLIAYLFGNLWGIFGPALVLVLINAVPTIKE